jgi:hypothetical protein
MTAPFPYLVPLKHASEPEAGAMTETAAPSSGNSLLSFMIPSLPLLLEHLLGPSAEEVQAM